MLANLPVEIILLICQYPELKELKELAWTNSRMMRIIKKYLPKALEWGILFYLHYENGEICEKRICLFDSHTNSVKQIAKFARNLWPSDVATTKDKIFAIGWHNKSVEIFDLNTRQINRGPDHPEWRELASVAYFKGKLYCLGGEEYPAWVLTDTKQVDVLIDGEWQTGPTFPLPINHFLAITCDGILYVICKLRLINIYKKIYRLSDDEQEWIEIEEFPEGRDLFGVASLNGRIYITGGTQAWNGGDVFKSCLCFDPSAPVGRRISRIADMNYERYNHSFVVTNGKLYAIGGYQVTFGQNFCNSIEEYDPQTNKWRGVGRINLFNNPYTILFYYLYLNNNGEEEGRICLFNSSTCLVKEIARFRDCYLPFEVATTQNKIFGINPFEKSFEIYGLNTQQILEGPNPPKWREYASVAYYEGKLYHLGGRDPETGENTNRVDVLIDEKWKTGPAFPHPIDCAQTIICDEIFYVIDGWGSKKIYRLSDDERKGIEIGEIPERRRYFGVASLDGRIYITGGENYSNIFKSCLCFDPSAPVGRRISQIAEMNYLRCCHSLVVTNGKLYAIGGFQKTLRKNFCNSIEEYDPQTNEWREVGILRNLPATSESAENKTRTNRTNKGNCLLS